MTNCKVGASPSKLPRLAYRNSKIIYFCDLCGKEILDGQGSIDLYDLSRCPERHDGLLFSHSKCNEEEPDYYIEVETCRTLLQFLERFEHMSRKRVEYPILDFLKLLLRYLSYRGIGESDRHILEKEALSGLSVEEKIQVIIRALYEAARQNAAIVHELRSIASTFENLLRTTAKILAEKDKLQWEKVILEALEDESQGHASKHG